MSDILMVIHIHRQLGDVEVRNADMAKPRKKTVMETMALAASPLRLYYQGPSPEEVVVTLIGRSCGI
jgi:hypothetical protein